MNLLFIANPRAGTTGNRLHWNEIRHWLPASVKAEWVSTNYQGHATALAKEAAASGEFDRIVAIGGDGTVNEVAKGLQHSLIPMGIIPSGSGNGVARHFGIPLHAQQALAFAISGKSIAVDAGRFNGHFFLCTAGVGLDGEISKAFSSSETRGFFTYAKLAIQCFKHCKPVSFSGYYDNKSTEGKALMLTLANCNQFGNNAKIAPGANASDGHLDLVITHPLSAWTLPWFALKTFIGLRIQDFTSKLILTKAGSFQLSQAAEAHVDGEWIGAIDKVTYRIEPSSVLLVAGI